MKRSHSEKVKRHVSVGRSIEEVMVRRKFDSTNPVTWPDPLKGSVKSQPLPNLETPENVIAKPRNYLSDYPEDDKQKMMDTLMQYCRALQNKVEDLEGELLSANNRSAALMSRSYDFGSLSNQMPRSADYFNQRQVYTGLVSSEDAARPSRIHIQSPRGDSSTPAGSAGGNRRSTTINLNQTSSSSQAGSSSGGGGIAGGSRGGDRGEGTTKEQMGKIMSSIDVQVLNLKELFRKGDPMDERRACATMIAALIRGFLARQWVALYRKSLREFTIARCRMVVFLVDILLSNQSKLDAGFHLLKMNRNMKTLHTVYNKWASVCAQNAPIRRQVKIAAAEKIASKRLDLMRAVFKGLRDVSIGTQSTKHANNQRRKLIESIRAEMSFNLRKQGHYGVVPEAEIMKMLHRRVVSDFWERKNEILKRFVWKTFVGILRRARGSVKTAAVHRFKQLVGRCFIAWSEHTFLVSMGLDRRRWPAARKYEVKYNQKRVDNFARTRLLQRIYKAWKGYFAIQYKVKCKFRAKVAQLVSGVFNGWRTAVAHQHAMRLNVYENWKGYARLMVIGPFQAWANHVKAVKNHNNEQNRICTSYVRWKWRQRIIHIMKVWRHQALYGRLDGLYSRQALLKTLGEQKILVNGVEKLMAAQTMELEDCRNIVSSEIVKRKELERVQGIQVNEISKLKMTNHNYEQELRKLESVIESMVKINPKQLNYLRAMHPQFKFKERNILLQHRGDGDSTVGLSDTVGMSLSDVLPSVGVDETGTAMLGSTLDASQVLGSVAEGAEEGGATGAEGDDNASVMSALSTGTANRSAMHTAPPSARRDEVAAGGSQVIGSLVEGSNELTTSNATYHTPTSQGGHILSQPAQHLAALTAGSAPPSGVEAPSVASAGIAALPLVSAGATVTSESMAGAATAAVTTDTTTISAAAVLAAAAAGNVTSTAVGATLGQGGAVHGKQTISDEDLLLLTRVKWLLARYADELRKHDKDGHMAAPLSLLQPKEQEHNPDDTFAGDEPAKSEPFDPESLVLKDRPSLLFQAHVSPQKTSAGRASMDLGSQSFSQPTSSEGPKRPGLLRGSSRISFGATSEIDALQRQDSTASAYAGTIASVAARFTNTTSSYLSTDGAGSVISTGGYYGSSISTRILLAFMDFLDFGDIGMFSEVDRREWIRHLLRKTGESAMLNNVFAGLTGEYPDEVDDVLQGLVEAADTPAVPEFRADTTLITLDNGMNGAKSWRDALMQFRCFVNTDPSIIANLRDENVNDADVAMFGRILAMRDNAEAIMKRKKEKHQAKLREKNAYMFGANASVGMIETTTEADLPTPLDSPDNRFPKPVLEPPELGGNIYASNLKHIMRPEAAPVVAEDPMLSAPGSVPPSRGFVGGIQQTVADARVIVPITDELESPARSPSPSDRNKQL